MGMSNADLSMIAANVSQSFAEAALDINEAWAGISSDVEVLRAAMRGIGGGIHSHIVKNRQSTTLERDLTQFAEASCLQISDDTHCDDSDISFCSWNTSAGRCAASGN